MLPQPDRVKYVLWRTVARQAVQAEFLQTAAAHKFRAVIALP